MRVTKPIDLSALGRELAAAGVVVNGLGMHGTDPSTPEVQELYTFDTSTPAEPIDLPPEAQPVVDAHTPPPAPFEYAVATQVSAVLTTTDDAEHDVFVLAAEPKSIYRAELTMSALDRGNGAMKTISGILVWKRLLGANVVVPPNNITVVSQIHDTAAASWVMNGLPQGGNFRIFVKGAAGRTIDWFLTGPIGRFAPAGLDGAGTLGA